MKSPVTALLVLLLIQGIVALTLYWPEDMMPVMRDKQPLISFNADLLDEIYISDRDDNEVILVRQGDEWLLPDLEDLPADDKMVRGLIEALAYQPHGRPLADTIPARQRFQVAAYLYQRRLTLVGEGELLGTIYLGTSPGFRRVHARNDAAGEIYSVNFNNFDAPASASAWLKRALLHINDAEAIQGPGFSLSRNGNTWVNAAGIAPDRRELEALLLALASQQIDGVADEDEQRSLAEMTPSFALDIETPDGVEHLEYFALEEGRFVFSRRYPLFFTLSDYDFDRITGIDATLLAPPSPESMAPALEASSEE